MTGRLLLVGCGKMGGALLAGWRDRGIAAAEVIVVEPAADLAAGTAERHGVRVVPRVQEVPPEFAPGTVVFAVKPQAMADVVPGYRRFVRSETTFLSIAAGTPIAFFKQQLGTGAVVVRAMPNTPAAVGRGIAVLCADDRASAEQRATCEGLLAAVGRTVWIADEDQMHAVTAVSGSGPAYVFLLAECLAEAGERAGLTAELATILARATVAGAGALLDAAAEPASELRRNVTSPGGTTAAALAVLMAEGRGLGPLMTEAVAAAARRSRELAG